eukprot:TRINITY_DN1103_c0_g2_i2.p1 TRINITY_DN1103_c0_g2~~TRINITY_DN1103_c0_g2_i2.p1  ORF type:complete len:469 (+),score=87.22 TRINITY_DN1103_c0_g2_i2:402-1808(+)
MVPQMQGDPNHGMCGPGGQVLPMPYPVGGDVGGLPPQGMHQNHPGGGGAGPGMPQQQMVYPPSGFGGQQMMMMMPGGQMMAPGGMQGHPHGGMQYVMMSGQVPDHQNPQPMMTHPGAGNMMFMPGHQMPQQSQMFPQAGMPPQGGPPQQMGAMATGAMMPMQGHQGQQGPHAQDHHVDSRGARGGGPPLSRAHQPKQGGGGWQANRPMGNAMAGGPGPGGYAPAPQPQMAVPPGQQPHMNHQHVQPGHQSAAMTPSGAAGIGGASSPKESDSKAKDRVKNPSNPWADIEDNPFGAYDKDMQQMWGSELARQMSEKGGSKGNGKDSKQQRGAAKGVAKGGCKGADRWQPKEPEKANAGAEGHYVVNLGHKGGSPGMAQAAFHQQSDADFQPTAIPSIGADVDTGAKKKKGVKKDKQMEDWFSVRMAAGDAPSSGAPLGSQGAEAHEGWYEDDDYSSYAGGADANRRWCW